MKINVINEGEGCVHVFFPMFFFLVGTAIPNSFNNSKATVDRIPIPLPFNQNNFITDVETLLCASYFVGSWGWLGLLREMQSS